MKSDLLTFSRTVCVRQNHFNVFPARVIVEAVVYVISQAVCKTVHEGSALQRITTVNANACVEDSVSVTSD